MKSSVARKAFHSKQANDFNIDINYFDAVDGTRLSDAQFESLRYTYLRPLSKGEVGCFLSHKALWEICLSINEPIIILEDDAILSSEFMVAVSQLVALSDIDRINLEGYYPQKKTFGNRSISLNGFQLTKLLQERAGAAAYMLWPSGARKLLKHYDNKATLADVALKERFLITYQLEPVVAVQALICDHYGIPHSLTLNETTLDSSGRHNNYNRYKALLLKFKRLLDESKKAVYRLRYIFSTRRIVLVDVTKFSRK